ncbi:MAG: hypothetical protein KY475_06635 [Planctomycetes bacterium]|nr:hypothetical protein [Planctomycetota bacterium]
MAARLTTLTSVAHATSLRGLGRWLAALGGFLASVVAAIFLLRRILIGFTAELSGGGLLLLTLLIVGSLVALRIADHRRAMRPSRRRREMPLQLVPTVAAVLLATAVSSPHSPLWAVILLWAALSIEETWHWSRLSAAVAGSPTPMPDTAHSEPEGVGEVFRPDVSPHREIHDRKTTPTPIGLDAEGVGSVFRPDVSPHRGIHGRKTTPTPSGLDADETDFPPGQLQQLTRYRDEDGAEVIHGRLRGEFSSNQRVQHLHVAFCPPLERPPELSVEQMDGPDAAIAVGQVESYGARIDVRLTSPAREDESVVVEFYARATAPTPAS